MKTGIIIQARMNSTRVPKKVALNFGGKPFLWHVAMGLKRVKNADQIIIATGPEKDNRWIINFAKKNKIKHFSHSDENNVLARFYLAAKKFKLDQIVRVCADNIFVSTEELENLIQQHLKSGADYSRNVFTLHPDLGAEIFTFKTLEKAYQEVTTDYESGHVTLYIYKTHPEMFKIVEVKPRLNWPKDIKKYRLAVDTKDDINLISKYVKKLFDGKNPVSTNQLIKYFSANDK